MSRFRKLSQTIWNYHIAWSPKYRYRVLMDKIADLVRNLREKPYWGNFFWSKGYCVDTVGLDSEMIRKYVKYQEEKERREEQVQQKLF